MANHQLLEDSLDGRFGFFLPTSCGGLHIFYSSCILHTRYFLLDVVLHLETEKQVMR